MSKLVITGVIDGPLTGGVPKAIELFVLEDIADLSIYGLGSANNGGGTDGQEFTLPAVSATQGQYIYVASETTGFTSFFGFAPDYTNATANINGDDAIELFENAVVVDTFGEINVDGTGQPWDYEDGWAYRVNGTGPDGATFNLNNWTFSGTNALDGQTSNGTATTPFLAGTFAAGMALPTVSITATDANAAEAGQDPGTFTITRTGDTTNSLDVSYAISGDASGADYTPTLTGTVTIPAGESAVEVTITPVDDVSVEGNETLTLTLTDGADYDLGTGFAATVTIADNDTAPGEPIDLSNYVRIGRYNLPVPARTPAPTGSQLSLEVSAVTYNPDTDTLFVLGDEGTSVVQVTKTGQLIDSMTLTAGDFDDPEGLTFVSGNQFVLVEERTRQANLFTYVPGGTLSRADVQTVKLGTTVGNIGLEGLSFDPQTGEFIVVKETSPQGIFQTGIDFAAGTATNGSPTTENSINLFDPALAGLTDIADVYAQSNLPFPLTDDNLLVLSQEDGVIVNIDRAGNITSSLTLASDPENPLTVAAQGHEGVTMDNDGLLYVVSERGGGDEDHPQLWVYAPASFVYNNAAPVEVSLSNVTTSLAENSDTSAPIQVGTILISDDALGTNTLSLSGPDAAVFEIIGSGLFLRAGIPLDFESKPSFEVTVNVDDASVGSNPDVSTTFTLGITDTIDTPATLIVSEVAPWSSGNSPGVGADWFEVTNTGTTSVDITGWKVDDSSNSFASAVNLNGVTTIAPNQSVIFVEGDATTATNFVNTWFGGSVPAGFAIGTYTGSGIGLSTGGDAVNLFDASGTLVTGVIFGASPATSPFATFDNAAGLPSVSTLSVTGTNGAFSVIDVGANEAAVLIGSPGTISVPPVPLTTQVAIAATDAAAAEAGQNPGTFTILRTGDTSTALEVSLTIGGDADAADYTPNLPTTVTIPVGASQTSITITPVDDVLAEGAETVTLTLVDTAAYDVAANATSATVTIADNDTAPANFDLQVTEIWPGNSVGTNLTADWFEITNIGTEAWVSGVAPDLYYDDDSQDPAVADLISGITQIDPGESVVVVVGNAGNALTFASVWGSVIDLTGVDIGFTDGAGLGPNGDGVALFVGLPGTGSLPVDFESYPAGSVGQSYDVDLMAFSVAGQNGAVATAANADGQSAVGSPGDGDPIVVEPSKILNETFDYAENGQPRPFTLTDANGNPIDFFGEATSFDYFGVLDGDGDGGNDFGPSPNVTPTSFNAYTGFDDNHLIASDIDGGSPAIADPAFLTWSGLNIAGLSNLLFSVDVATQDADNGLDPDDFLKFEISVDGGAFQPVLAFETADGSTSNQATFLEDTDFDGIGDGSALTSAAQTFTKIFSVSGTTLDLRAAIRVEAGLEDIGFDNVMLEEASGSFVSIAATNADQAEGDAGTTPFTFTVTRSGDTSGATSVDFAVTSTVADTADFGGLLPTGTVNFAAGETTQVVSVNVSGDTDAEPDESFTVTLSNATGGATITTAAADGTIRNDDGIEITKIHTIQGNASNQLPNISGSGAHDDRSPLEGQSVTVQGVVTAVLPGLSGFFLQEESTDADADPTTSEGIFVFTGGALTVIEGNLVTVTGAVDEFFGMTQLDNDNGDFSVVVNDATNAGLSLISPAIINLPATGDINDFYEQYEGMLVQFSDKLVVSEYFELARFGQIVLTEGDRPFQYTHTDNTPTAAEFQAFQENLARRQIILDDDNNVQNQPLTETDGTFFYPQPNGFGTGTQGEDFFRGGDSITNLTGVLQYGFSEWRIRPTEANPIEFTVENPRPATPADVGGNIKVANFNVLNYFTTLDVPPNTVGPSNLPPRGANSADEFARQTEKLVAALAAIDADVFGLVEIENDADDSTLQTLVDALNAEVGAGTYDFIPTGFDGTDAIKVGILYKPGVVTPTAGKTAVLEDPAFTDPNNTGSQQNRPALGQEFEVTNPNNPDFGEAFSVVVNHLKSKGSSTGAPADNDQNDGQGASNDTRTKAAEYLANVWIPQLIAQGFDEDFLITGDLNAYRGEDPITAIKNAGYTDLIEQFIGDEAYSFVFDGQLGYLDHALANASLTSQVTGVTEWSINADEVPVFDYNDTVLDSGENSFEAKPTGNNLYEPNAFRTSDHDPVIIGLDLASTPSTPVLTLAISPDSISENGGTATATITRNTPTTQDLVVTLATSDPSEATVPTSVTILAGETSASFQVSAVDDNLLDGTQSVDITATAGGFVAGTASLAVLDDDFTTTTLRIEAEAITNRSGYRLEGNNSASGGQMLSLVGQGGGEIGTASVLFSGPGGTYDIVLGTFDEKDGASSFNVTLNGAPLGSTIVLDQNTTGSNVANATTRTTRVVATGVTLATGDSLVITGIENGGEHARFDYIEFTSANGGGTNQPPTATDDAVTTTEATVLNGNVLSNDSGTPPLAVVEVNGNPTVGSQITLPSGALLTLNADGSFSYNPNGAFNSLETGDTDTDSFTYLAENDLGVSEATVTVTINGVSDAALSLSLSATTLGEGNTLTATVTRNTGTSGDLTVNLASSDTTEATVPASIIIPNGQTSVSFDVTGVDDNTVDGNQSVTLTASANGFSNSSANLTVTDGDVFLPGLTIEAETITNRTGYRIENNALASGGSLLSLVGQSANEVGTATFAFNGASGTYEVILGTFDENDGAATLTVTQNGSLIGSPIVLNQNPGGNAISANTKVERSAGTVTIATGDVFTITGTENGGEHARFDFIRFEAASGTPQIPPVIITPSAVTVPEGQTFALDINAFDQNGDTEGNGLSYSLTGGNDQDDFVIDTTTGVLSFATAPNFAAPTDSNGDNIYQVGVTVTDSNGDTGSQLISVTVSDALPVPVRLEAEDALPADINTYRVENIGVASGGQVLSFVGGPSNESGSASFTLDVVTGTYDIILGAFDENDGEASFTVEVNGTQVSPTLVLNQPTSSPLANGQTDVMLTAALGISLSAGDTITVFGFENGAEHARLDFLDLIPTAVPV